MTWDVQMIFSRITSGNPGYKKLKLNTRVKRTRYSEVLIIYMWILNKCLVKINPHSVALQLLNELSRMQSSVSEQQEMGRRLQEKEQTIKALKEQVNTYSLTLTHSSPPTAIMSAEEVRLKVGPCSGFPVFAAKAQIELDWDMMLVYIWQEL